MEAPEPQNLIRGQEIGHQRNTNAGKTSNELVGLFQPKWVYENESSMKETKEQVSKIWRSCYVVNSDIPWNCKPRASKRSAVADELNRAQQSRGGNTRRQDAPKDTGCWQLAKIINLRSQRVTKTRNKTSERGRNAAALTINNVNFEC